MLQDTVGKRSSEPPVFHDFGGGDDLFGRFQSSEGEPNRLGPDDFDLGRSLSAALPGGTAQKLRDLVIHLLPADRLLRPGSNRGLSTRELSLPCGRFCLAAE